MLNLDPWEAPGEHRLHGAHSVLEQGEALLDTGGHALGTAQRPVAVELIEADLRMDLEELALADCLSRGRVISGFARGLPREHSVFGVPMTESRARFEEAVDVILGAWTEDVFNYDGRFHSYKDIAIWPRPYQQPHPPVFIMFAGSKESVEFAGKRNFGAVFPYITDGLTQDLVGYYARMLAQHGHTINPEQMCVFTDAYVADDRATALAEYSPWYLYFNRIIWHHGSINPDGSDRSRPVGYVSQSPYDYVRPENRSAVQIDRGKIRNMTPADVEARVGAGHLAWGSPDQVADRLITVAERSGANQLVLNVNLGVMPHAMFMEQIRRFGREVLPRLQAHEVTRVPAADALV